MSQVGFQILKKDNTKAEIRSWLPWYEVESGAFDQLVNTANHDDVGPAIASMPDAHQGYGVPIGCVFPTIDAIVPNAVGVDIGCGMTAVNTGYEFDIETMDADFWATWEQMVNKQIPKGFSAHSTPQELGELEVTLRAKELQPVLERKAAAQLGSLGGGNHFLEAQVDEEGGIWVMVHSGSRGIGNQIASHYHKLAIEQSKKRGIAAAKDLSSLLLTSEEGQNYIHDMRWATDYALESRVRMVNVMRQSLEYLIANHQGYAWRVDPLNCHHNYAAFEEHYGERMVVHRKGATSAELGQLGIIPGSMGSNSYIVRGKGNTDSFNSCSHGAGRRLGRGKAKSTLSMEDFEFTLRNTFSKPSLGYLDEAPMAYKDIEAVMDYQSDLVDIVHTLQPIITLKGDVKAPE